MKQLIDFRVRNNERLSSLYVLLQLEAEGTDLPLIDPGQFVEVKTEANGVLLRRPISVHWADSSSNELWLLVATIGDGTNWMGSLKEGSKVNILVPLGNGFPMPDDKSKKSHLLVGGGVGIAPLLYLGAKLVERGDNVTFLLGFRNSDGIIEKEEYSSISETLYTTEDGSYGEKGFVTNHSIWSKKKFDTIYACGPTPMMKAVAKKASETQTECWVSLENMMACGLGACLCCVTEDKEGHNRCVCTDGPVFNTDELPWQI